jgi:hypothetical protein
MLKPFTVIAATLALATAAQAASGDAWAEFAVEVEQSCIAAAEGLVTNATAVVDPFGSESFGLALVTGETPDGLSSSLICVFDKQTKAVEIGGELDVTVTPRETAEQG